MQTILDFHTHAYPEKVAGKAVEFLNHYYHVNCEGDGTIGDLTASAKESGVSYLLVHSAATRPDQVENINTFLSQLITPNIFCFGTIHPGYPKIQDEMERLRSRGLRGLKLHPDFQHFYVDTAEMDEVYEIASEFHLP
ncbi:MAG TPA: amidohydrolase, partial [Clostridia bacterium]|nr:amidohydrolase [Clostridia bacterium]